jgi:hypothetical protein
MKKIKFGSKTTGMGDIILLTSVCKYFPNKCIIQLPPDKEKYSILFDGIADVEITENPEYLDDVGFGHYSAIKLRNFFGELADYLDLRPLILHSTVESEKWAIDYLRDKPNPVIVVPTCSPQWKEIRNVPKELVNEQINVLISAGLTPILCQSKQNYYDYPNLNNLFDLDLSKYICLLRRVGQYIGANTGDKHLAIGVGCVARIFQPKLCNLFNPFETSYKHPSIQYMEF